MTASLAPTSAVSSSPTTISSSTPAVGEGISVSTLSVDTSSSGSSSATSSPTSFSQRVTVPSVTDSPSAGRTTSVPSAEPPPEAASAVGAGAGASASAAGRGGLRGGLRLGGRGLLGGRGRGGGGRARAVVDDGQLGADLDGLVLGDLDGREHAGGGRGDLGVDLVGRHLQQRLVGLDALALGLQPAGDGALGDALTECRKGYGNRHGFCCSLPTGVESGEVRSRGRRALLDADDGDGRAAGQSCECSGLPARARWASPSASFCVGWAWMSWATSEGSASQL